MSHPDGSSGQPDEQQADASAPLETPESTSAAVLPPPTLEPAVPEPLPAAAIEAAPIAPESPVITEPMEPLDPAMDAALRPAVSTTVDMEPFPVVPPPPLAKPTAPKIDVSAFLRALIVLTTVGASLGGFVAQLTLLGQLDQLIAKNEMPGRLRVELAMGGTGLFFLLASLLYVVLGRAARARRVESLHGLAVFLLPATLMTLIPPLFRWSPWATLNLELLIILAAFGFVLEQLVRLSLSSVPPVLQRLGDRIAARTSDRFSRWFPAIIVCLLAIGYAVFASIFTIIHHYRFGTACWDLGQYDNLFYNALHGHPFRVTSISGESDWKSLRGHAELGMYFILPFYGIRASSEALLVIQATLLGSAVIPIYLFGKRFVSTWAAMFLAIAYVLYAPMHRSNFYDFHMQPIAAAFTLWMLYFFIAQRNVLFWISFIFALTAREDISIGLATFGLFLMVTGYRFRVGFAVTCISITYFVVLKGIIMPLAGGWWFADIYKLLQIPGKKGYGSIVETLISNPDYVLTTLVTKEKLILTLQILLPIAFLPMRRAYLLMSLLPGFFFTLLTTGYNPTVTTLFQYNGYWISYVFPAAAVALRVLGGESARPSPLTTEPVQVDHVRRRAAIVTMLFLSFVTSFHFGALLQHKNFSSGFSNKIGFGISGDEWKRYKDMRAVADMIPKDVKLAATEHVAPHVSSRVSLYCFRESIGEADYIIYGALDKNGKNAKLLKDMLHTGKIGVIAEQGDFYLFKKGAGTARNAEIEKRL